MLGSLNKLHFRQEGNGDIALAALHKLPETTEEVRLCCDDLKVLGRKEFKLLLRWRLKARDRFGLRQKKTPNTASTTVGTADDVVAEGAVGEEVATLESMDDEMRLQEELQRMKEMQDKGKRKERRKENERKQKETTRLQLNMITPTDIGLEQAGPEGQDATFRLKDVDKAGIGRQLSRGRMHTAVEPEKKVEEEASESEDEVGDRLEDELDEMYNDYTQRREDRDAKLRAKRARMQSRGENDDEFDGFSGDEKGSDAESDDGLVEDDDDEDSDSDEEEGGLTTELMAKAAPRKDGLTNRAASFFEQDIFKDIGGLEVVEEDEVDHEQDSGIDVDSGSPSPDKEVEEAVFDEDQHEDAEVDSDIEEVDTAPEVSGWESEDAAEEEKEQGRPNIDIITAEAMTLAHQLATGKITKQQLADDNFNKFSHRDVDGLPEWFLDDEGKHSKPHRPITAEAAKAIKEKQRALNARPIKKVREAKGRKALRTARRIEKLKRKSDGLAEGDDLSEKDKAGQIAKLMAKAKSGIKGKQKQPVKVVVAGGQNKGKGRPRGVKGKYKMVDSRLKKDVRAEKRLKKKMGKK